MKNEKIIKHCKQGQRHVQSSKMTWYTWRMVSCEYAIIKCMLRSWWMWAMNFSCIATLDKSITTGKVNPLLAEFRGVNPTRSFWNIFIHHCLSPLLKKKTTSYAILSVILALIIPFTDCFGSLLFHYFSSITSQVTILLLICTSTRGKRCDSQISQHFICLQFL